MKANLGLRLRDKLGPEASQDLSHAFEEVQNDMLTITTERFEGRLIAVGSELRSEIYRTQSELREEMARMDASLRITLAEACRRSAPISARRARTSPTGRFCSGSVSSRHGDADRYAEMGRALKRYKLGGWPTRIPPILN
jgi:hypothetical protein